MSLAAKTNSYLELHVKEPGGPDVFMKVTPVEAKAAKTMLNDITREQKREHRQAYVDDRLPALSAPASSKYDDFKTRLSDLGRHPGGFSNLDPAVMELIRTLVLELNREAPFRMLQLQYDLEAEGVHEAAELIRTILKSNGPNHPLLISGS